MCIHGAEVRLTNLKFKCPVAAGSVCFTLTPYPVKECHPERFASRTTSAQTTFHR
jgi:hypothetical protein